ncbi:MAG: HAD family hydrolase [Caldilineaceae bacterium]|nr:HAD family hydrolase [Caldilineaceae bacterium]
MQEFECDAILFDLDGVLVDSTAVVERQWQRWAIGHQIPVAQVMAIAHGRRALEIIQTVAPQLDSSAETLALAEAEANDTDGLRAYQGAYELLTRLPATHWAVATSGTNRVATARLQHTGLPIPPIFVTADDVPRGKPNPDPYLLAAQRLKIDPQRCLVFEDAPAGIQAGLAAGARVIGIASSHARQELQHATAVVNQLAEITVIVQPTGSSRLYIQVPSA